MNARPPSHPVKQFRAIADRYLEASWELFPEDASEVGLHEFDSKLSRNDPETHLSYRTLISETLTAVEAIPDGAFTGDDWLDRRGFLSMLRTTYFFNATHPRWKINPQQHCDTAIGSLFHLVIRNTDRLPKIRPALESRLAQVPRFLDAGAACLQKPIPLWTKLAVKSCDGAVTFLKELGKQLASISPDPAKTNRLIDDASHAFRRFAKAAVRKPAGASHGFSIGTNAFEFLLRERTGLPYSLREVRAIGERLVAQLEHELALEAKKWGRKRAGDLIDAASERWELREPSLFEEYEKRTTEVRAQFEKAGIVTFPKGERCKVVLVPPFLRHQFPTAAYNQPGAFDSDQTGIFWVNDLSLEQRDPARKAAEIRQHFGLEFTCAHEAYPGHHLQFALQNQHPSKLRRLFAHAIFYEGWTLWCEKMAVDEGIIQLPEARLLQLHDALWRAHRIGIDCGLHDGTLTYSTACKRLQDGVGFTAARARGDVNWYTSSPTIPLSYLLGRLEVERLHAHLVVREGWSLKQFNDWMLSFGAIPWSWIWQAKLH